MGHASWVRILIIHPSTVKNNFLLLIPELIDNARKAYFKNLGFSEISY